MSLWCFKSYEIGLKLLAIGFKMQKGAEWLCTQLLSLGNSSIFEGKTLLECAIVQGTKKVALGFNVYWYPAYWLDLTSSELHIATADFLATVGFCIVLYSTSLFYIARIYIKKHTS